MLRRSTLWLFPVLALTVTLHSIRAAEGPVDDAIKLVKAGLNEEVLSTWVDSLPAFAPLSTDAIVALKAAQVPDKTIAALVRKGGQQNQNSVREIARYDTGGGTNSGTLATRPYTSDEATQYTYRQPRVVYADYSPVYTSSYYPYYASSYPYYGYYGGYYPYRSYGYYGGWGWGGRYYGHSGLSISFGHSYHRR